MRNRFGLGVFGVVAVFATLVAGQASHGQAQNGTETDPCAMTNLPAEIQNKLTTTYAAWKILAPALLTTSEGRRYWLKHHPKECPGILTGTFSDDNQVGYVLELTRRKKGEIWQQVLYFHPSRDGFSVEILNPSRVVDPNFPVSIDKLPPDRSVKTDQVYVTLGDEDGSGVTFYWKQGRRHKIFSGD
ncbi:MAG TPA: hypothetical protein VK738_14985 [Terriglobales bacterium]|jgi:hypothetical protein|nr:hypothetical protein [Terriglobales bacterium]